MPPENFVEVSFEVANKVGGIYQVLKSKAGKMKDYYGETYYTIGFYDEESASSEFAPRELPEKFSSIKDLEDKGIEVHYGVWRVPGQPKCFLVDSSGMEKGVDEIKEELYEEHGVDSIEAGNDFDDPVKWSYAVGELIEILEQELEGETVVQLHEWLSGPAMMNISSPAVFTTHATVLGRTLSSADYDLKEAIEQGRVDGSLAEKHGVKSKHQTEKMAASEAEVFTTVSETTGEEAEAVLGVEPDKILSNGFNVGEFPSLEELSYQHKKKKEEMKEFLRAYFKPYYDVDLENDPRVLFISGRYEFRNKGVDIFIDALSELNESDGEDFFVFFFIPTDVKRAKPEVLENMSLYQELEDYVDSIIPELRSGLINALTSEKDPGEDVKELIDGSTDGEADSLRRNFHKMKERSQNPPNCAFDLNYPEDQILDRMHEKGLRNREEDRVKVVFYPTYLSMGDRLLSMGYNDAIVACSAGIFPSSYEPWGYTPVETAANGALSITTDMAGFGKFLLDNTEDEDRKGIRVLERENVSDGESVSQLADMLEDIVSYSKTEITERKHNARKLAQLTSWERLGENYREAHGMALER